MTKTDEMIEPAHPAADGYVILVEFDIATGFIQPFIRLVRENARLSVEREPGCRRFDVLLPVASDSRRVVLYEIYEDRAAFDDHLGTGHFLDFDEATRSMVAGKRVSEYSFFEAAKRAGSGGA